MLKPHQDAQGWAIYDCFCGKGGYEVIERSDGYIDVSGGPEVYLSKYEDWSEHEKIAMGYVVGRVLDVGCGAGRHLLYLQEQGFECVGVDISPKALEVCKKRGLRDVRLMSITQLTSSVGIFDTILMMGNNFGLFGNTKRAKWLLRRFHRITAGRARIIAESTDPYATELPEHLEYHSINRRRGRMGGQLRIRVRYKKYKTPWFDYLIVSKEEMRSILEGTGWGIIRFIDSTGPRYIAIIEKL